MKRLLIILVLLSTLFLGEGVADYDLVGFGARPIGIGAFTALADDPHAIFYNPSGLGRLRRMEATSTYGLLYPGLTGSSYYNSVIGRNLEPGIGEGIIAAIYPIDFRGTLGIGWQSLSEGANYREDVFILSYGVKVSSEPFRNNSALNKIAFPFITPDNPTYVGISLKILDKYYGTDNYTPQYPALRAGTGKWGISADIGAIYHLKRDYAVAFMIRDLLQPNMSLENNSADNVPMTVKAGFLYHKTGMNLTGDVIWGNSSITNTRNFRVIGGGEYWITKEKIFALRGSMGVGSNDWYLLSLGGQVRYNVLQYNSVVKVDYSVSIPLRTVADVVHRVGVTISWGNPRRL